jgi:hypothetical protein
VIHWRYTRPEITESPYPPRPDADAHARQACAARSQDPVAARQNPQARIGVPAIGRVERVDPQATVRYLPERLGPLGARVETALRERLALAPSFVAFGGYDTVAVLADVLRSHGADRARIAESWPCVAVEGTRGQIQFSRPPGISVWQWAWTPIQVVDRDPAEPDRFRILHAG